VSLCHEFSKGEPLTHAEVLSQIINRLNPDDPGHARGHVRRVRLHLDPAQYALDAAARQQRQHAQEGSAGGGDSVYSTFNVIMKRKAQENNFKAVLECIRQLMNAEFQVPEWLHDVLLGYGDPKETFYTALKPLTTVDFNDTLLDQEHVRESFPKKKVTFKPNSKGTVAPPFRVTFDEAEEGAGRLPDGGGSVVCEAYLPPDPGPYPERARKTNSVRFTPVQVGAILAGTNEGLTQVVGPPGTGKTDTAVQIIRFVLCGARVLHVVSEGRWLLVCQGVLWWREPSWCCRCGHRS
jgi:intron-binding protein aquarius